MKIAIASDNQININEHFGMSRGFVIVEIKDNIVIKKEFRMNTFTNHAISGHGNLNDDHKSKHSEQHSHTSILNALNDCEAVISKGMGMRIFNDLNNAGIKAFITVESDVDKAVNLYIYKKLDNNPGMGCSQHN